MILETIPRRLLDAIQGMTRITLSEDERMLVLRKGRFEAILGPGETRVKRHGLETHRFLITRLRFVSDYEAALVRERPDLVAAHLTEVATGPDELALVVRDGRAYELITQDTRVFYWSEAADWTVERIALGEDHAVPVRLAQRLMRSGLTRQMTSSEVPEGKVGLLSVDGVFTRMLAPGTYWFWMLGRKHLVRLVDTRWQAHEVTGQEILTRDRVTLRVNLTATYRVHGPRHGASVGRRFFGGPAPRGAAGVPQNAGRAEPGPAVGRQGRRGCRGRRCGPRRDGRDRDRGRGDCPEGRDPAG